MRKILLYFALKYQGDYKKIYQAIKNKEKVLNEDLVNIENKIKSNYVTIIDKDYPPSLKSIANPPFVLFYYGDISLLYKPNTLAIIGKRKKSIYGKQVCINIVKGLKVYNSIIISGLALGIDSIAHQCALDNNLSTIAVLGSGIDYCYPTTNLLLYENIKNNGLVISEYPNDTMPCPNNFLIRNRIIAALSDSIIVIEANYKSGTMNTVSYGLEFGKDIYAVPHLANSNSGCNYLIKQGAKLIETAKDIFE